MIAFLIKKTPFKNNGNIDIKVRFIIKKIKKKIYLQIK
jgi:hypothetical protein